MNGVWKEKTEATGLDKMWKYVGAMPLSFTETKKDTVEWWSRGCYGSQGTKVLILHLHCVFCELFSINSLSHMFTDFIFCYPTPFWNTRAILELFGGFKKLNNNLHFKIEGFSTYPLSQHHVFHSSVIW